MDNYFLTKKKLFDSLGGEGFAIINSDDQSSNAIISKCIAKIVKYGVTSSENNISNISRSLDGVSFNLGKYEGVKSKLLGLVNIYNISAAILCLIELGVKENILSTIEDIDTINGRLEKIYSNKFNIIVDYAHTPDAMEKVLLEVKPLVHNKLITLFGCGGNRDKSKRALMGNIASKYSDIVYITSDNPRNEDPFEIITNIKNGCLNDKNIIIESDRNKAIINALSNMNNGDLLMVLGKGHEEYQIIKDKKIEFSDKKIIKTWLQI
jgi:UDP-N-acetylmuramoyl-L-alanyl-D-glutamate--2,6-diaminopimelate ligase